MFEWKSLQVHITAYSILVVACLIFFTSDNSLGQLPEDKFATLLLKGNYLYAHYNYSGAINYFSEALSMEPNNTYVLNRLGEVMFDSGHAK